MAFEKDGFVILRDVLDKQSLTLLTTQFRILEKAIHYEDGIDFNNHSFYEDRQVPFSFPWYSHPATESLLLMMQERVETIVDKKLFPCYSYMRIMHKGAYMKKHTDRPSCEYSATLCLYQDGNVPYPIFIENYSSEINEVILNPGDMIVYNGTKLPHWREEYLGDEHIQSFLHYVDSEGPYKNRKFDFKHMLGLGSQHKTQQE